MKKLSILALALAALLTLSACGESTTTSQQATVHQPNIDEITSNTTSDYASTDSDYSSATSSTPENGTTARPTKPEIPQVAAISPSKLEYEFVNKGDYGAGIRITGINTAASEIRFPDAIDGEPVVYIDLSTADYSENVKTLIFPDTVGDCGFIPKSVEFVKLPAEMDTVPEFYEYENLKQIWMPDKASTIGGFGNCSSLTSINIPDSVTSIERQAFSGCEKIQATYKGITYSDSNINELYKATNG